MGSAAFAADPLIPTGNIVRAALSKDGFGPPAVIPVGPNARSPVFSRDGLSMYYGKGEPQQVWLTTRASRGSEFGEGKPVASLAWPNTVYPSWLSPDGCRLYLSTDPGGNYDLYFAEKTP